MKDLNEFEATLLRILRCLMHRVSVEQTLSLLVKQQPQPTCLSRKCVELIQDTLSKGVTAWLARSGWMSGRSLLPGRVLSGRLWHRHSPESLLLTFTPGTMQVLIWLTSENFADPQSGLVIHPDKLSLGDRVFLLMTFAALQSTLGGAVLMAQPGFSGHGLIELLYPASVAEMSEPHDIDIAFWLRKEHSWVLEALQMRLAQQWFRIEQDKRLSSNSGDVQRTGNLQAVILARLFDAAERSERKDLCVFLLVAGRQLFQMIESDHWFEGLDMRALRVADRTVIYRAGLAFFYGMQRLQEWTQRAQAVGFYDEEYHASQLWKSEWERLDGACLHQRAQRIIAMATPMQIASASS